MEITFSKKIIFPLILFLWIVFSVAYIVNDVWSNYKNVQLVNSYEQGRTDTINALIQEAERCQPFSAFVGERQVQLIKINCPPAEEQQASTTP